MKQIRLRRFIIWDCYRISDRDAKWLAKNENQLRFYNRETRFRNGPHGLDNFNADGITVVLPNGMSALLSTQRYSKEDGFDFAPKRKWVWCLQPCNYTRHPNGCWVPDRSPGSLIKGNLFLCKGNER